MKKIFAGILTAMLMLGVTSCGSSDEIADSAVQNNGQNASSSSESLQSENTSASGSKTLVVVYSASGNTKAIAEYIVSATGADLFEITPRRP